MESFVMAAGTRQARGEEAHMAKPYPPDLLKEKLDALYQTYNCRAYVDPDPLLFLYDYPRVRDREIAGLVAACLAYGRVELIMKTVAGVLEKMGPSPHAFLSEVSPRDLHRTFCGFTYRFARRDHLVALLSGIQNILKSFGSIEQCFETSVAKGDGMVTGLSRIYSAVHEAGDPGHLLADPGKTSACKRSHLYLRWMVRQDDVDPGGWDRGLASGLIVPIDTHMYRIGTLLGFTRRKAADKGCALEITEGFRQIAPHDPVKYDFSLTRYGIRRQFDINDLKAYLAS